MDARYSKGDKGRSFLKVPSRKKNNFGKNIPHVYDKLKEY